MSLKNYYRILGVPQTADLATVKAAFRVLAKKYHPDRAPDNPFAAAHFTEIQEAYEVLSKPNSRARYDEERWLRGLSTRSNATQQLNPAWLLSEAQRLLRHLKTVDTYHMNHLALRDFILSLLCDENMSVLSAALTEKEEIAIAIMGSTEKLRFQYVRDLIPRIKILAADNPPLLDQIHEWYRKREGEYRHDRYRPYIIIGFAIILALLIWFFSGRTSNT